MAQHVIAIQLIADPVCPVGINKAAIWLNQPEEMFQAFSHDKCTINLVPGAGFSNQHALRPQMVRNMQFSDQSSAVQLTLFSRL
jgi:hypothetical protein